MDFTPSFWIFITTSSIKQPPPARCGVKGGTGRDGAWGAGSGERRSEIANKSLIILLEMHGAPTNFGSFSQKCAVRQQIAGFIKKLRFPIFLFSKIPIYGIYYEFFYKIRNLSFKNSGKFAFPPRPSSSSLFMQNPSLLKQYPSQQMILNPVNSKDKFPIFLLDFMHHLNISTGRNVFLLSSFPFHCLSLGPSLH